MNRQIVNGVYAASLIPMQPDYRCDVQILAQHCKELLTAGCQGVVLFGTAGEGASFSVREKIEVLQNVQRFGLDTNKIIFGVICTSVADAVELVRAATEQECAGVLLAPPFYYKSPKEEGVLTFYRQVLQQVSQTQVQVILYHIPQLTGVPLSLNIVRTLLQEFPQTVVGIKESEGNFSFTQDLLMQFPGFKLFVGNEGQLAEAVRQGGSGAICGLASVYPQLICSLYEHGKDPTKPNHTEQVQNLFRMLKSYSSMAALKCILEKRNGASWHLLRPPLLPLNAEQSQALFNDLANAELKSLQRGL